MMNNYGSERTTDFSSGRTTVVVEGVSKKQYPKTRLFHTPLQLLVSLLLLLLMIPIIILVILNPYHHHNADVVTRSSSSSNNNNNNNNSKSIISLNYDAARTGPICVSMDGNNNDTALQFRWKENHNLYQLPTENSFQNCDFSKATLLQKAGPNPTGYDKYEYDYYDDDDEHLLFRL